MGKQWPVTVTEDHPSTDFATNDTTMPCSCTHFDLLALDGDDPLTVRKATLRSILGKAGAGVRFNEHIEDDHGETVFRHACKMGLEGIVSKRKDSPYRSGRSPDWLKMKNPACEAVRREEEEDWGC
jgi:bifunctional non-homologous end joining protein LigD